MRRDFNLILKKKIFLTIIKIYNIICNRENQKTRVCNKDVYKIMKLKII